MSLLLNLRCEIVNEARTWIDTPYHRRGAIKGVGCDCGSYPGMVLVNCGLVPRAEFDSVMDEIRGLADDWFLHRADELYTDLLSRYARNAGDRFTSAKPLIDSGNIILMQTGNSKRRNHAGIVTNWPKITHCMYEGVREIDASRDPFWAHKNVTVFDPC